VFATLCDGEEETYSDCGKDILELVHEGNEPRVVDIYAADRISCPRCEGLSWLGMCLRIRVGRHDRRVWWLSCSRV
jgi:hypothetical protein